MTNKQALDAYAEKMIEDCDCPECGGKHLIFRQCSSEPLNKPKWRIVGVMCKNCGFGITKDSLKTNMTQNEAKKFFFKYLQTALTEQSEEAKPQPNQALVEALKYTRRFLNKDEHDTEYVDKIIANYTDIE